MMIGTGRIDPGSGVFFLETETRESRPEMIVIRREEKRAEGLGSAEVCSCPSITPRRGR